MYLVNLLYKALETHTPQKHRIGTISLVRGRNIGAESVRIRIAWYCDNCTTLEVWLTRATSRNAILCEAEGDAPEVVGKVDVVVLEAELRVRRIWSDTSTPEASACRTENWHLRWVQWSIS